jgi:hypothetical protein
MVQRANNQQAASRAIGLCIGGLSIAATGAMGGFEAVADSFHFNPRQSFCQARESLANLGTKDP